MEWLSDYVLAFLKSPSWVAPIAQFVDERCIIFEDEEENKLEYTECHNEYKELIDSSFAAHLLEIDVTGEQFEQFCQQGLSTNPTLHRVLVEQILSADDFLIFKAMMTKRNADLYREAQRRVDAGHTEDDFYETMIEEEEDLGLAGVGSAVADEWKMYEEQLFQALDESQKADDQLARERQKEEEEMERAIAMSLQAEEERQRQDFQDVGAASSSEPSAPSAPSMPAGESALEEPAPPPAPAEAAAGDATASATSAASGGLPPLKPSSLGPLRPVLPRVMRVAPMNSRPGTAASISPEAAAPPPPPPADTDATDVVAGSEVAPPPPPPQPSEEERQARFEHLQRQRQLLVEKRNKDRQRQLEKSETKSPNRRAADQAPSSHGAASGPSLVRELTGGTGGTGGTDANTATAAQQMRQVLASQLKQTLRGV